jgi:enoyl-[acyl-carrier-protein] reductase (NADH)
MEKQQWHALSQIGPSNPKATLGPTEFVKNNSSENVMKRFEGKVVIVMEAGAGIPVHAIAPTVVKTEGLVERIPWRDAAADEMMKRVIAMQTLKRPSTTADVANALSFLVSEDADFITGQILHVDGGFSRSGA